jgi:hypothetical protein
VSVTQSPPSGRIGAASAISVSTARFRRAETRLWACEGRAQPAQLLHGPPLRARQAASRRPPSRRDGQLLDSAYFSAARLEQPEMTAREDTALIAAQLADLTRTVQEMGSQLAALRERADREQVRADSQQERTQVQQERIDLAARELADVSERLQAAANALRESI